MSKTSSLLFLLFVVFTSCNSKTPVANKETVEPVAPVVVKDSFETGVVIPSIALRNNADETFALYLPKIFKDSINPHCIIFFDPHGDGAIPVEKYKALAENKDFILIGSNFSRNENAFENNLKHAEHLTQEVITRLHPFNSQVNFCGFSGGAKVALTEGPWIEEVSHVIYTGAVIQPQKANHAFKLLGIAGNRDMNYTDLVSFYKSSQGTPYAHDLIEWNGKHEWPDEKTFANAFQFVLTGAIAYTSELQPKISNAEINREQTNKQQLLQAFQSQDLNWWKQEIALFNTKKKTDAMYERLLGFVSLACYSYSNQSLQQNNLEAAEKILTIYALADPGNKDCETFMQELRRRTSGK